MALTTITLTGTYKTLAGTAASGRVTFVLAAPLLDTAGRVIYASFEETVSLDSAGSFTLALPATDDPTSNPSGNTYQVIEELQGVPAHRYPIQLQHSLGSPQDLSQIAPSTGTANLTYTLVTTFTAHTAASQNIHGIADTAQLATLTDLAGKEDVLGYTPLAPANNLSDVAAAATARFNIIANRDRGYEQAENHGADPASLDNTAALQEWITAGTAANRALEIGPGNFVTGALPVPTPLEIVGAGMGGASTGTGGEGTVAFPAVTTLTAKAGTGAIFTIGQGDGLQHQNTRISNMRLVGNGTGINGIAMPNDWYGVGLRLESLYINGFTGAGVVIGNATGPVFARAFLMQWTDVQLVGNQIGADLWGRIQASSFRHCHFADNTFRQMRLTAGSTTDWGGTTSYVGALHFDNCTWENHTANSTIGVAMSNIRGAVFNSCWFECIGTSSEIQVSPSAANYPSSLLFEGCEFVISSGQGIVLPASSPNLLQVSLLGGEVVGNTGSLIVNGGGSGILTDISHVAGSTQATRSHGSATIGSAATSIVVNHGLLTTPAIVQATPTASLGSATKYWVSAKGATSFTISVDAAPGSNVAFDWYARVGN